MKIARFLDSGHAQLGIVEDGIVYRAEGDVFAGPGALRRGEAVGELEALAQRGALLPPVAPGKIVAVGLNYALHVTENDPTRQVPDEPVLFMKPTSALLPHGGVIALPPGNRIDYEAELCIVIGRRASRVPEAQALDYVLGYTCGNDVSHRDYQRKDGQWVRAKGFDTFCPLGPVIETELSPSAVLRTRLNGELKQEAPISDMVHDIPSIVAYASSVFTLLPGDVILTGTPSGIGPMKPGDTVEVEVEGVGSLVNPVRAPK